MLNEGYFRDNLVELINNPGNYTKEQLYEAFLEVAERYLDEMTSNLCFERDIIAKLGKKAGYKEINRIAMSNPALKDLAEGYYSKDERKQRVLDLLAFIECEFDVSVEGDEDEEFIDLDDEDMGGENLGGE